MTDLHGVVRQGDCRQAGQGSAWQAEVGVQGGAAFQLEGVGASQGGHEEEGQRHSLQGQESAVAISWNNAEAFWEAAKACSQGQLLHS